MERSEGVKRRPLPPFPFSEREGAVQHCKARHFVLPLRLYKNAEHGYTDNLLVPMLNNKNVAWPPSPLEREMRERPEKERRSIAKPNILFYHIICNKKLNKLC